jgi:hypothetical protein
MPAPRRWFAQVAGGATLRAVAFGREEISEAERDGRLTLHGDRAAAGRFTRMFPVAPPLR